ncbi:cupin domain-containing protein [Halomontanus rarus]|uniref:cupin domain-containing protein n=1 Tax=Halomontanus rarus TaxID=3034020 RepID=UPI001A996DF0
MDPVAFDEAETYEPDAGWRRAALAGSDAFSFEWFEKPPGHSSPLHDHENEQVCVCLEGQLTVATETDEVLLEQYDSVHLESGEPHHVENTGDERAVGLDVFAPGRSFDFWLDRQENDAADRRTDETAGSE